MFSFHLHLMHISIYPYKSNLFLPSVCVYLHYKQLLFLHPDIHRHDMLDVEGYNRAMNMSLEDPISKPQGRRQFRRLSQALKSFYSSIIPLKWRELLLHESRLKNNIVPFLKWGLVINVHITALSLRLLFYLILPQSVCRTLEGWQMLITLYDATNSVSVISVASKCFPGEYKGIKLPLNYTSCIILHDTICWYF